MHQKTTRTSKSPVGIAKGFRSGLERATALQLAGAGLDDAVAAYESLKIKYTKPQSSHTYTPDWPLPNGVIVETKGVFSADDRKKHLLVKDQHPELDIRFVFTRSKEPIYKGSPTTYASWCIKNGFQFADKRIPDAWLREEKQN